MLQIKLSAIAT